MRHGASIGLPICLAAACAASPSAPRKVGGEDADAGARPAPTTAVVDVPDAGVTVATVSDASGEAAAPCAGVDGGAVDVFVRFEVKNKTRHAIYDVPSVNARGELFPIQGPANCDTQILRAAQRMVASCTFSPSSFVAALALHDGNLEIDSLPQTGGIDGPVAGYHIATVRLGCGVHLVLHGATWRDPKWVRFGSDCESRCYDKYDPCGTPCWEKDSDEHGELTEKGHVCFDACRTTLTACLARCRH